MKKIILLFLIVSFWLKVYPQEIFPKIGITKSFVSLSDQLLYSPFETHSFTGFIVGIGYSGKARNRFSFQTELVFHQKGWNYSAPGLLQSTSVTGFVKMNYLEFPLLVKAHFGQFHFNTGLTIARGLNGSEEESTHYSGNTFVYKIKNKIVFGEHPKFASAQANTSYVDHIFDLVFQFGCGVKIAKLLIADLRFGRSLTNYTDKSYTRHNKSKFTTFQLTLAFPFKLKV